MPKNTDKLCSHKELVLELFSHILHSLYLLCLKASQINVMKTTCILCRLRIPCHVVMVYAYMRPNPHSQDLLNLTE